MTFEDLLAKGFTVKSRDKDSIIGLFRDSEIRCEFDRDFDRGQWLRIYIMVECIEGECEGMYSYDGWAPDTIETLEDACVEAVQGACLV